jgi:hypothetical protein
MPLYTAIILAVILVESYFYVSLVSVTIANSTINHYDELAESFFKRTPEVDISVLWDRFSVFMLLRSLLILDVGSGYGRDSAVFLFRAVLCKNTSGVYFNNLDKLWPTLKKDKKPGVSG